MTQGLFIPDSLAGAVPCGISLLEEHRLSVHLSGRFSEPKSIHPQVSHPMAWKVSVACVMQRGLRDGEQPDGAALTLCFFLCMWPDISLSIAWVSPSPMINHKTPHGG